MIEATHLTDDVLLQLLQDARTNSEERDRANGHILQCSECSTRLRILAMERATGLPALLDKENTELCLEEELLFRYVRRKVTDFESDMAEIHIEECLYCRLLVEDLQAFAAEEFDHSLTATPITSAAPAPEAAVPTLSEPSPTFWERLRTIATLPRINFALAGAATAALILAVGTVVSSRSERTTLRNSLEGEIQKQRTANARWEQDSQDAAVKVAALSRQLEQMQQAAQAQQRQQEPLIKSQHEIRQLQSQIAAANRLTAQLKAQTGQLTRQAREKSSQLAQKDTDIRIVLLAKLDNAPEWSANLLGSLRLPVLRDGSQSDFRALNLKTARPAITRIEELTPILEFVPERSLSQYKVKLTDVSGKAIPLRRLSETRWQVTDALQHDQKYLWSVEGIQDGVKYRSAYFVFRTLSVEQRAGAQRARELFQSNAFGLHAFDLGVYYARIGLFDAAEREFSRFLRANPASQQAKNWLLTVQSRDQGDDAHDK